MVYLTRFLKSGFQRFVLHSHHSWLQKRELGYNFLPIFHLGSLKWGVWISVMNQYPWVGMSLLRDLLLSSATAVLAAHNH